MAREGKATKGKGQEGRDRKGKERTGQERKGKERKGKERKGKERKGKERKGKERKRTETKSERQGRPKGEVVWLLRKCACMYASHLFDRLRRFFFSHLPQSGCWADRYSYEHNLTVASCLTTGWHASFDSSPSSKTLNGWAKEPSFGFFGK